MTTLDTGFESELSHESDPLRLLAHGSPLSRTLEAAASVAASIGSSTGCGILLVNDDHFVVAAAHGLTSVDERQLDRSCQLPINDCLARLLHEPRVQVRSLVTSSAELVGALVVFGLSNVAGESQVIAKLDEVCAIAILAIESKNLVDELYFRAHHDTLTQTWNRIWMQEEIATVLDRAADEGTLTGLFQIGVDSFRVINELLGSKFGNELLKEVADRIRSVLRPNWSLARCSGDEFLVLLPDLVSEEQGKAYAEHILQVFEPQFAIGDHQLIVRATIGTAFSLPGECRCDTLQSRAEIALHHGKRSSRARVSVFTKSMVTTPPERLEMERHLRFALQKGEFEVFYQPQIQLSTGRVLGVEALLRWRHPFLGFISPATFIPIAEQIGLIDELGAWVLGEAVHQLARWRESGLTDIRVAVNVSALQFAKEDFASLVAKSLRRADINPGDLELEITESAVMTNFEHAARQLRLLRSLGILIALDDFGTGHSSLAYLQQLPIRRIKIDRMFVKDIVSASEPRPLLSSIIHMAGALNCSVIAEGIETAEQAQALANLGCDEVQGFFFSKPVSALDIVLWSNSREPISFVKQSVEAA